MFTKNRERLLQAEVAHKFLAELLNHKEVRGLLSDEHFSVDGTQVAAWASMKSFRAKDGSDEPPSRGRNGERDFHGETRSNDTHASTTDPDARLYRKGKGKEAKLSYIGNALTENRHGLVVEAELGSATGTIERDAGVTMVVRHSPGSRRLNLARRRVAVIVATGGITSALAAKSATSTIPIVFQLGADPVEFGLVASLSRPGGNVTGVSFLTTALVAKRLELLHEIAPNATFIGFLVNPTSPQIMAQVKEAELAARVLGCDWRPVRRAPRARLKRLSQLLLDSRSGRS